MGRGDGPPKSRLLFVPNMGLGDLIQMTASFEFAKRHLPGREIHCAGFSPVHREMLANHPYLDGILPYRDPINIRRGLRDGLSALATNLNTLRLCHEAFYAYPISRWGWCTRLPLKLLRVTAGATPWVSGQDPEYGAFPMYQAYQYALAKFMGLSDYRFYEPLLVPSPADVEEGRRYLESQGLVLRPTAALAYDAGKLIKRLPVETAVELCDLLASRGYQILLLQGKNYPDLAQTIASKTECFVKIYAYEENIRRLIGVLSRCGLVVSPDTGISHLAAALRVPNIVLFGPSSPIFRPGGGRTVVVQKSSGCAARDEGLGCLETCRHRDFVDDGRHSAACMYWFGRGDFERALESAAGEGRPNG